MIKIRFEEVESFKLTTSLVPAELPPFLCLISTRQPLSSSLPARRILDAVAILQTIVIIGLQLYTILFIRLFHAVIRPYRSLRKTPLNGQAGIPPDSSLLSTETETGFYHVCLLKLNLNLRIRRCGFNSEPMNESECHVFSIDRFMTPSGSVRTV